MPSLRYVLVRCVSTVRRARCSSAEISAFVRPSAASAAMRRSLTVSESRPVREAFPGRAPLARRARSARPDSRTEPSRSAAVAASLSSGRALRARPHGRELEPVGDERGDQLDVQRCAAQDADGLGGEFETASAAGGRAEDAQGAAPDPGRVPHGGVPALLLGECEGLPRLAQPEMGFGGGRAPRCDDGALHVAGGLAPAALPEVGQGARVIADGRTQHAPRIEEPILLPAVLRRAVVGTCDEPFGLGGAAALDECDDAVGQEVARTGAGESPGDRNLWAVSSSTHR